MCGLRRNPLRETGQPVVRRPCDCGERHGLFVDYGGNLPTTPWATNKDGRGTAWCNSLFEDNAEFGLGYRVSIDKQKEFASEILKKLAPKIGDKLVCAILNAEQRDEAGIFEQRQRVARSKRSWRDSIHSTHAGCSAWRTRS